MTSIAYHLFDIPENFKPAESLAIDTEAMGLMHIRDRLCVVQIASNTGEIHVVHFPKPIYDQSPNLVKLMQNKELVKIMHFARFDVAIMQHYLKVEIDNVFCTKIASRLCRTYTDMHGLKELCSELLQIKISKQHQSSDWGAGQLSQDQLEYAASDVLHLHAIRNKLIVMLQREGRMELAQSCFDFIPARARLDLVGWAEKDIFSH